MAAKTYSFADVVAALSGPGGLINVGAGAGPSKEGVTVTPGADANIMQIGADGGGQHSMTSDFSGTITIRLLKTSPTNALLAAMLSFQRASAANWGQNTFSLADKNRNDIVTASQVAFKKWPDLTFAEEAGVNEWVFDAVRISMALGA